ncbi:hypothetical protein TB1_025675 [Malus domestica]
MANLPSIPTRPSSLKMVPPLLDSLHSAFSHKKNQNAASQILSPSASSPFPAEEDDENISGELYFSLIRGRTEQFLKLQSYQLRKGKLLRKSVEMGLLNYYGHRSCKSFFRSFNREMVFSMTTAPKPISPFPLD